MSSIHLMVYVVIRTGQKMLEGNHAKGKVLCVLIPGQRRKGQRKEEFGALMHDTSYDLGHGVCMMEDGRFIALPWKAVDLAFKRMKEEEHATHLTKSMKTDLLRRYNKENEDQNGLLLKISACITQYTDGIAARQKLRQQVKPFESGSSTTNSNRIPQEPKARTKRKKSAKSVAILACVQVNTNLASFFTYEELGSNQQESPGRDESSLHEAEDGKWILGTVVSLHKNQHNVKYYKCQFNTPSPRVLEYNSAETQTGIRNLADLRAMAKTPSDEGQDDESGSSGNATGSESQSSDEGKDAEVPPKKGASLKSVGNKVPVTKKTTLALNVNDCVTKLIDGVWVNGKIIYSKPVRDAKMFGCKTCYTVMFEDNRKLVCSKILTESMLLTYRLRQHDILVEWTQDMQTRSSSKCSAPPFLEEGCNSWLRIPKLVRYHHGLHEFGLQFPCGYTWYVKLNVVMSFLERSQAWKESANLHDRKLVAYAKDEVSTRGPYGGSEAGSNQSEGIVVVYSLCLNKLHLRYISFNTIIRLATER